MSHSPQRSPSPPKSPAAPVPVADAPVDPPVEAPPAPVPEPAADSAASTPAEPPLGPTQLVQNLVDAALAPKPKPKPKPKAAAKPAAVSQAEEKEEPALPCEVMQNQAGVRDANVLLPISKLRWDYTQSFGQIRRLTDDQVMSYVGSLHTSPLKLPVNVVVVPVDTVGVFPLRPITRTMSVHTRSRADRHTRNSTQLCVPLYVSVFVNPCPPCRTPHGSHNPFQTPSCAFLLFGCRG